MSSPYTFRKDERISSKKEIDFLFENGTSFTSFPLRISFVDKISPRNARFSVLISVPKRRFKRAVHRNRIKRLIRESYRLNKALLWDLPEVVCPGLNIGFVFVGNEMPVFKQVESAVIHALSSIKMRYEGKN